MTTMKALIIGSSGQDGTYMSQLLSELGYDVYSMSAGAILPRAIQSLKPDEIYHLAAMNNVRKSYDEPVLTMNVNTISLFKIIEAVRNLDVKIFYACSSEMYGKAVESPQTELTPFNPQSPYAVGKIAAFHMGRVYREAYGMKIYNGILYNHESPKRREEFLSKKVCKYVASVKNGVTEPLKLGNIDALRDWGWAPEYCETMWSILQNTPPDDYIIASGELHSVKEFIKTAFAYIGVENWEKYITFDEALVRPLDVNALVGDATKLKKAIGFEPRVRFKEIVETMVEFELNNYGNNNR